MALHPFTAALHELHHRHLLRLDLFAKGAGVSTRTASRWVAGERVPKGEQLKRLVRWVNAFDREGAERLAASSGASLQTLGVVAAAAPAPSVTPQVIAAVDSTILALAESLASPPGPLRPALVAALERMRLHGLSVEAALRVLAPSAPG